ncbi:MAG TPA: hypothetical protein VM051_09705 [Usitatibacter sp.]|nr:hypothetical protein [Usitatibacter sp.]
MKFLALAWAIAAFVLFSDARAVRDYLSLTGSLGLRGAVEAPTPLKQTYPAFAADAQTWVRHALALAEGGSLRLRHTTIDNAPAGRDVHWNSAWAWTIAGAGVVHHLATGTPSPAATEKATLWLMPAVLLAFIALFSAWTLRRLGLPAAVFLVAAMTLHERILEGFFPSYVDHHGLLTAFVLGMILGIAAMLRGVHSGATLSALCGAFGLWVSAASVAPAIAAAAVAGWVASGWQPGDARAWRSWGLTGAAASLGFHLLEYFPEHLQLRLEVNHPLYAMAWLGAAELIARRCDVKRPRTLAQESWPWLALLALPVTVAAGGASVIAFADPFMARLHADHIREFLPLWTTMGISDTGLMMRTVVIDSLPLVAALATIAKRGRASPPTLVFTTLVAAILLAMAWWQVRWQMNASAAAICLTLVLVDSWTAGRRPKVQWLVAGLVAAALYLPGGWVRYHDTRHAVATKEVGLGDIRMALARDVAAALRASQPAGDIVLLASPDASTSIGYYGRFRTLGTLYWENAEGLKAAAAIFSAHDNVRAHELARERGITHIALVSDQNFLSEYYSLLEPASRAGDVQASFGWRLLSGEPPPEWLERIPYQAPPDLSALGAVLLFKTK